jgi:NDP-sugar pyrophosphorylase family protein
MSTQFPDVLILAGGFGTRLQSVVSDVPKPMAPVAGKPFFYIGCLGG